MANEFIGFKILSASNITISHCNVDGGYRPKNHKVAVRVTKDKLILSR